MKRILLYPNHQMLEPVWVIKMSLGIGVALEETQHNL